MQIRAVPILEDNYGWLVFDESRGDALIVDPGDATPVLRLLRGFGLRLKAILLTHHHVDHVGGVSGLVADAHGDVRVLGSAKDQARVPGLNRPLAPDEELELLGEAVHCMAVPGHTRGATAYYLPRLGAVFTGDTLLCGGCGRLFEGTPAEMVASLARLRSLPESTLVYCGHEYTEKNLRFAAVVDPANHCVHGRLARVQQTRGAGLPTVPSILCDELKTNPFMRTHTTAVQELTGLADEVMAFAELRRRRDAF